MRYLLHLSFALAVVLPNCGQLTWAQSGVAERPRVSLVTPTDASTFDSIIQAHFPSLASNSNYQTLRPLTVAIVNNTAHRVKAVAIKWVIEDSSANSVVRYSRFLPNAKSLVRLAGAEIALQPGGVALTSPFATVGPNPLAQEVEKFVQESSSGLGPRALTVRASLDSIIFDGGVVIGKDESGMVSDFVCQRNEIITQAHQLLILRGNDGAIRDFFQEQVNSKGPSPSCSDTKARVALELRNLYSTADQAKFFARLAQIDESKPISLGVRNTPVPVR